MNFEGEMKRFLLIVMLLSLVMNTIDCSKNRAYSSEESIKRGDVVYQVEVANLERFEQFLTNLSRKEKDTVRVTGYTDEGTYFPRSPF